MATDTMKSGVENNGVNRPLAHFPPDVWGDRFTTFNSHHILEMETLAKEIEPLKEEVRTMLMDTSMDPSKKMSLIDAVERLGVSYYFQDEINELLDYIFETFTANNFNNDDDLCSISSQFRIFRQYGYKMPCGVFNKFTNEEGKFKATLTSDIRGMVSLYEASHLRIHGESILDEAIVFTSKFLRSVETSCELSRHALKQALHLGIPRVESRHFIDFYEKDESKNETLLRLAKMDYNRLQLLYRQELSQLLKWWKNYDFANKLPYARQRCVECHFWSIAMYYEPHHSYARLLLVKVLLVISILDDTYDAYATFEEIQLLTHAFERWDLSAMDELPGCLKLVFGYVTNVYDEFAKEMTKKGKPYAAKFAKERVMDLIRSYYQEAKWLRAKYIPTFEEYMVNARITGVAQIISTSSIMGMEEIMEVKPFEQIVEAPKAIRACEIIGRLMDDIVSHEEEQARGHVASGVECYMKEFNKSREEVVQIFNQMIEDAWKELNEEFLVIKGGNNQDDDYGHLPKPVLKRILNLARVVDALYSVIDGYTYSAKLIKDDIIQTYDLSIPL